MKSTVILLKFGMIVGINYQGDNLPKQFFLKMSKTKELGPKKFEKRIFFRMFNLFRLKWIRWIMYLKKKMIKG